MQNKILIVDGVLSVSSGIREALIQKGMYLRENIVEAYTLGRAKKILKSAKSLSDGFLTITTEHYLDGDMWAGLKLCEFIIKKLKNENKPAPSKVIVFSRWIEYLAEDNSFGNEKRKKWQQRWRECEKHLNIIFLKKQSDHTELLRCI